jgi:hypothetical protein
MRRQQSKKMDALVLLAKAAGGRRKRQSIIALVILVGAGIGVVALFLWLIWPEPHPGRWALALYDQLALPSEPVALLAQLEAEQEGVRLSGRQIHFDDPATNWQDQGTTDARGRARATASFSASEPPHVLQAGYPGNPGRHERGALASGRVFAWPADAEILVVDADRSLSELDETRYSSRNNADIQPVPDVLSALRSLRGRFRLVYWTRFADRPVAYIQLRAWLESAWNPAQQFPDGPVMLAGEDATSGLASLRQRFQGRVLGGSRDPEFAEMAAGAGMESYLVGNAESVPQVVRRMQDWTALVKTLAP